MRLDAYLQRIGYSGEIAPTRAVLEALHLGHATHIPFENLDVLRGVPIRLDIESIQAKLVDARRGGYCFEQNQLLGTVLESVGFTVTRLAARVCHRDAVTLPRTHMLLLVTVAGVVGGAGGDSGDTTWLADVGFGAEGLLLPVPFAAGQESRQFAWTYRVAPGASSAALRDGHEWTLQSRHAEGWVDLYGFTLEPQLPIDYEVANHYTSTHPDSRFRKTLTVQLTSPQARTVLRNRELLIDTGGTATSRVVTSDEEIRRLLEETFGLPAPPDLRIP